MANFEGECVPFCDENIQRNTDISRVRKLYKLNTTTASTSPGRTKMRSERRKDLESNKEPIKWKELEMSILGLMALRGAT